MQRAGRGRSVAGVGAFEGSAVPRPGARRLPVGAGGFSILEAALALALLFCVGAIAVPTGASLVERWTLGRAAELGRAHLGRARLLAVARRETLGVRVAANGDLLLLDPAGAVVAATSFSPARLDSVRLRPSTLRFNTRGQAAPGSLYLYRGKRGVRLVSNFLGRVRREDFRFP